MMAPAKRAAFTGLARVSTVGACSKLLAGAA
jgi:hypothetical protein